MLPMLARDVVNGLTSLASKVVGPFARQVPRRANERPASLKAGFDKSTRRSPGTLGTCFSGTPDTIRTSDCEAIFQLFLAPGKVRRRLMRPQS